MLFWYDLKERTASAQECLHSVCVCVLAFVFNSLSLTFLSTWSTLLLFPSLSPSSPIFLSHLIPPAMFPSSSLVQMDGTNSATPWPVVWWLIIPVPCCAALWTHTNTQCTHRHNKRTHKHTHTHVCKVMELLGKLRGHLGISKWGLRGNKEAKVIYFIFVAIFGSPPLTLLTQQTHLLLNANGRH